MCFHLTSVLFNLLSSSQFTSHSRKILTSLNRIYFECRFLKCMAMPFCRNIAMILQKNACKWWLSCCSGCCQWFYLELSTCLILLKYFSRKLNMKILEIQPIFNFLVYLSPLKNRSTFLLILPSKTYACFERKEVSFPKT